LYKNINIFRAKHAKPTLESSLWGVDGDTGNIVDMNDFGVWEPSVVKRQTIKTAIEVLINNNFTNM
jgi:T-complex protein 1 subunit gamma